MQIGIAALLCGGLLVAAFSCSKKPTKPQEKKGVRLYVHDGNTRNLYAFDAETHEVLDSLPDSYVSNMVATPDGKFLFVSENRGYIPDLRKVSTKPMQVLAELPMAGHVLLLERGTILLQSDLSNLLFFDVSSFTLIRTDSLNLRQVAVADTVGFLLGSDSHYRLVTYDFRQRVVLSADSIFIPDGAHAVAAKLALHPTGREGYAILYDSRYRSWFTVFETPNLKLKAVFQLHDHFGYIAVSPNGRYVLFDDPGDPWHGYHYGDFHVYDADEERVIKSIDILYGDSTCCEPCFGLWTIAFVPDGSRAFVSCGMPGGGAILVFEMAELKFVDQIGDTDWQWFVEVAVGLEP